MWLGIIYKMYDKIIKRPSKFHETFPFKGIVSRDWEDLQMVSMDRFEVQRRSGLRKFFILNPFSY
jgi:hypothetical protein